MTVIENKTFGEERALYGIKDAQIKGCVFAGEEDGESALKETGNISVSDCRFLLRYPFWHAKEFRVENSVFGETARAPFWYCADGEMTGCTLDGVKMLRECDRTDILGCKINSPEFGWMCRDIFLSDSDITSEYFMLRSSRVSLDNVRFKGKYSFQYTENVSVENCVLDTKDAFWHTKNAVVSDCVIKGEYLGWYSEGLTLINCKISGTQPLCYCKDLRLINCTMDDADLAFEYSEVEAEIKGNILSVKNPLSGHISAGSIGEIISDSAVKKCSCVINVG